MALIPLRIKVGPFVLRVMKREPESHGDGRTVHATFDYQRQEIELSPKLAKGAQREALLHEVLHACWTVSGLADGHRVLGSQEEHVISSMAPVLLDVMQRNAKLVEFFLAKD